MRAANLLLLAFICAAVTISYFSFRTANRIHSLPEEEPSPSPYRRKLTPSPLTPEMAALQLVSALVPVDNVPDWPGEAELPASQRWLREPTWGGL